MSAPSIPGQDRRAPFVIDAAAANKGISDEEFETWTGQHSIFLSSVMGELAAERAALADALAAAGLTVRWFEELGGRDDSAQQAYLDEVAGADVYLGVLGDQYGGMLPDGFSATHAEYLEARRQGKRVSFWARGDSAERVGHARNFLNEVQVFHVTGSYHGVEDLPERVLRRLREMATEDLCPWIKLGGVVLRAEHIKDSETTLSLRVRIRDGAIVHALDELCSRPWGRPEVRITYGDRSGKGRLEPLEIDTQSQADRYVQVQANVEWTRESDPMAGGVGGYSANDLSEAGLRMGLLDEEQPAGIDDGALLGVTLNTTDPLDQLQHMQVPEGAIQSIARLLIVEALVGGGRASFIERFSLGPAVNGRRRLELTWRAPRRYSTAEPEAHSIVGSRRWG